MQMRETSKEDLPDIYCDLDQVLVAFIKGAEKAIGGDFAMAAPANEARATGGVIVDTTPK